MRDGARDALAGYLYQIVGTASLRARAIKVTDSREELSCELIELVQKGTLHHEEQLQDALVTTHPENEERAVAIQFKYSRTPIPRMIRKSELIKIIQSFDRSRKSCVIPGVTIDRFVLITNRTLDASAEALFRERDSKTTVTELPRPKSKSKGGINKQRRPIVDEYNSPSAATKSWNDVRRRLEFRGASFESFLDALRDFATDHGLDENEFDEAIDKLVGSVMDDTVRGHLVIDRDWLTRCFVRARDALTLHLASERGTVRAAAAEKLHLFLAPSIAATEATLISRRRIERVREAIHQFPIVFVTGDGGCGKSVLAAQSLLEESSEKLVLAVRAWDATSHDCLGRELNGIRSRDYSHDLQIETPRQLLDRLRRSNPETRPPLLVVDLDGLDEVHESSHADVRGLINLFWNPERPGRVDSVLVLTCRTSAKSTQQEKEDLISIWLNTENPQLFLDHVETVPIGEFNNEELRTAARRLGEDVHRRIGASLKEGFASDTNAFEVLGGGVIEIDSMMVDSLRHPVMWGVFAILDPSQRSLVLSGDRELLNFMARQFLNRFSRKSHQRRSSLSAEQIEYGLRSIGNIDLSDQPLRERQVHWIQATPALGENESAYLYREALSYGLIREESPGVWRWRHVFVGDYLREER
jgi:hypothetical protein